jgi:hypothetical protein
MEKRGDGVPIILDESEMLAGKIMDDERLKLAGGAKNSTNCSSRMRVRFHMKRPQRAPGSNMKSTEPFKSTSRCWGLISVLDTRSQ